jgi:hypothetical protein
MATPNRTELKHGDRVVFSEQAPYQEYPGFGQIAEILKAKYGERIQEYNLSFAGW